MSRLLGTSGIVLCRIEVRMGNRKYAKSRTIGPVLGLDWYIGDNIGTDVILTSSANPGKVHDYDNNKYAVLHEIVHAYINVKNPDIHLRIPT